MKDFYVFFVVWVVGRVCTEKTGKHTKTTQPRLHTYVYMLMNTYILLHTQDKQMQIKFLKK